MKNRDLDYDWLDYLALQKSRRTSVIKEEKIRDFVSGRNAVIAQDIGVIDVEFQPKNGDFISLDPAWISSNIVNVDLINGGKAQFHKKYADSLKKAFESACRATGWSPENIGTGYCPKPNGGFVMRRSRSPSESAKPVTQRQIGGHAWGTSIDLGSASENPMGGGGKIRQYPEFINAMKKGGFIWGGDWSNKDDMHFEVNVTGAPVSETGGGLDGNVTNDATENPDSKQSFLQAIGVYKESLERSSNLFQVNDESKDKLYKKYKLIFDSMFDCLKEELKITKPVKINLLHDEENSGDPLGKTGGYLNEKNEIEVYTSGRHIKDILRSISHELVHHKQNIRGEFLNPQSTEEGYAQDNKHLRKMEKEAYLKGNLHFRDWEDNYKYRSKK
jgi:hypothetical protein